MNNESSRVIAERIADDIKGRAGIGDEYWQIDEDIREEMLNEWAMIIDAYIIELILKGDSGE